MENNYKFGRASIDCLLTCHPDLQAILNLALQRTNVDFGISQGARTKEQQQQYFNEGKSRVNPSAYATAEALAEAAKHIVVPGSAAYSTSRAADIYISEKWGDKSLAYNDIHLAQVAGVIISVAKELYAAGEISHIIRWGGDWNSDGVIGFDQKLNDFPHFELIKP